MTPLEIREVVFHQEFGPRPDGICRAMHEPQPTKPTRAWPRFQPGHVLTADELNLLVEYGRWLEWRIDELERWKSEVEKKQLKRPEELFIRPRAFVVPPPTAAGISGIPFRIFGRFSDRTEEDLTAQCQCSAPENPQVAECNGAAPSFRLLPRQAGQTVMKVRYLPVVFDQPVAVIVRELDLDPNRITSLRSVAGRNGQELTDQPVVGLQGCTYEWKGYGRAKGYFPGNATDDQIANQQVALVVLTRWQAANEPVREIVVLVRRLLNKDAELRVTVVGQTGELSSKLSEFVTPIPARSVPDRLVQPVLLTWEGTATGITLHGPPVVGYMELHQL